MRTDSLWCWGAGRTESLDGDQGVDRAGGEVLEDTTYPQEELGRVEESKRTNEKMEITS